VLSTSSTVAAAVVVTTLPVIGSLRSNVASPVAALASPSTIRAILFMVPPSACLPGAKCCAPTCVQAVQDFPTLELQKRAFRPAFELSDRQYFIEYNVD